MKTILSTLLLLIAAAFARAQDKTADLIIHSVKVMDIQTGKIRKDRAIVIQDEKILAVIPNKKVKDYTTSGLIDGGNRFAMPGLWDMHVHFGGDNIVEENKNLLPLYLAHGVTTVRDCAGDISDKVIEWRDAINEGSLNGPTIFTSGPKLEGINSIWPGDLEIGSSSELFQALDSLETLKVDFVKITDNTLRPQLYLEALKEVRKRGWEITGHSPGALTLQEVMDAGLSGVEHIYYAWRAGVKDEESLAKSIEKGEIRGRAVNEYILENFDTAAAMRTYREMARKGVAVTPTLNSSHTVVFLDQNDHKNDPYLQYIGKGLQRTYEWRVNRAAQDDAAAIAKRHEVFEKSASILPLLQKAGVKIMAGTDAGYLNSFNFPGIGIHQELALLVHYGLTPLEALQASVINSPDFLHKNNYGKIASGKKADIVLLNANPLKDIQNTQRIHAVIAKGIHYDRTALDQMLEAVKLKAAETK
ncbi:Imidazolonepropionase [Arenibacter nanhaiticus]|uniref:Imidazolonepropionase n=1 Tax=Arenibacter nanhaiticus TaxID=558155 RepID=A0A1M6LF14_9FLAO|nr:amidohydrolase family protein [Arenibacter nanhaiticus]SHJ69803.1 Imidazolonepropionase [Arenibacter nanhaiticus]